MKKNVARLLPALCGLLLLSSFARVHVETNLPSQKSELPVDAAVSVLIKKNNYVNDRAQILGKKEIKELNKISNNLQKLVGSEMGVMTVQSMNDEPIAEFSRNEANRLKLGRAEYNDGIFILLVKRDKEVRIEVGLGLEHIITNEIAAAIIKDDMLPKFKTGDYGDALNVCMTKISGLIEASADKIVKQEAP